MSWTDERVQILRNLWLEGRSASQISAVLGSGITRNAVIGKAHRLGIAERLKTGTDSVETITALKPLQAAPSPETIATPDFAKAVAAPIRYRAPAPRKAAPIVSHIAPKSLSVTIANLKDSMCKWPVDDPSSTDFRYCGSTTSGAGPYCQNHAKLAYQPAQDRRKSRDRERDRRPLLLAR